MIKHRDIGHDWGLSEAQRFLLNRYLAANQLLADCMNESRMLLPAAQLDPPLTKNAVQS